MWCSLQRLLLDSAGLPERVALGPDWLRPDFVRQVHGLAGCLRQHQVRAAALYFGDAARFACALLACARAGIDVYLPPNAAPDHLGWAGEHAGLWLTDGALPALGASVAVPAASGGEPGDTGAMAATRMKARPVWLLDDTTVTLRSQAWPGGAAPAASNDVPLTLWSTTDAGRGEAAALPGAAPLQADHGMLDMGIRLWMKTSGSSGQQQVVSKTLAQFGHEAQALARCWGLEARPPVDAVLGSVSPQHLYGLSFRVMLALCAGWPMVRQQCVYPESVLEQALRYGRSVWICSPVLLDVLGEDRVAGKLRGRVDLLVSSAGGLAVATAQRLHAHLGCQVQEIYGSTETGAIANRVAGTPWRPLPGVSLGTDAADTLWVESPWSGGRQQLADVVSLPPEGDARTSRLADGFLLLGRRDRVIKLADKRVSLMQLEQQLAAHPWVAQAHCALHPGNRRLAAGVALAEPGVQALRTQGRKAVVGVLQQFLLQGQDAVALPRSWRFVRQLPRDDQGKLTLVAWQKLMGERPSRPDWRREGGADAPLTGAVADHAVFCGRVPLDLLHFAGHFENFPLVPGVVELDWVQDLARSVFDLPAHLVRVDALKFRQFVRPDDEVRVRLDWQAAAMKLGFSLETSEGVCASGRLLFAASRQKVGG